MFVFLLWTFFICFFFFFISFGEIILSFAAKIKSYINVNRLLMPFNYLKIDKFCYFSILFFENQFLFTSQMFYFFFSLGAILSVIFLFTSINPVNSILHLVLVFLNVSFLILILEVEYLALTFMIVYIGAISMLFVFLIMMLDIRKESLIFIDSKLRSSYKLLLFFLFLFILLEFYILLFDSFNLVGLSTFNRLSSGTLPVSEIKVDNYGTLVDLLSTNNSIFVKKQLFYRLGLDNIGHFLYTNYFIYLYIVGFVLLVPMIGAIVLTNRSKQICFSIVTTFFSFKSSFLNFKNLFFPVQSLSVFLFSFSDRGKLDYAYNDSFDNIWWDLWDHMNSLENLNENFLFTSSNSLPVLQSNNYDLFLSNFSNSNKENLVFALDSWNREDFVQFFQPYFDNNFNWVDQTFFMDLNTQNLNKFGITPSFFTSPNLLESVSIGYLLIPAVFLFVFGLFSMAFIRKHILIYLMAIEIMLLGISLMLVIFSLYWIDPCGDILVLLILCVAGGEVVIALAITVGIYRNENNESIAIGSISNLRY